MDCSTPASKHNERAENFRLSRQRARDRALRCRHHWTAELSFQIEARCIELEVSVPDACRANWLYRHFTGQAELPPRLASAENHLEVLVNQGRFGFLMRLVRRAFATDPTGPVEELADLVFRLPKRTLRLKGCFGDIPPDGELMGSIPTITPALLAELIRHATSAILVLDGHPLYFRALYHQGRVHRIGEVTSHRREAGKGVRRH